MPLGPNSITFAVRTVTGNYIADNTDCIILVDAGLGAVTITLPAASRAGLFIMVTKADLSINAVTVQRTGTDTIQGVVSRVLVGQFDKFSAVADGVSKWIEIGKGII